MPVLIAAGVQGLACGDPWPILEGRALKTIYIGHGLVQDALILPLIESHSSFPPFELPLRSLTALNLQQFHIEVVPYLLIVSLYQFKLDKHLLELLL